MEIVVFMVWDCVGGNGESGCSVGQGDPLMKIILFIYLFCIAMTTGYEKSGADGYSSQ